MSTSTWTGAVSSDWTDARNWSPAGLPLVNWDVVIASGTPVALASASIGTVNSITDSSGLAFESAGTNTVTTVLDNTGSLDVDDNAGAGGTILNIGGTLTNSHRLAIGNATLSASDRVTATALDNTGAILLNGSGANQALLDVTAGSAGFGTAGVLSGYVRLAGDSAIEFASGQITSLAKGAHLGLHGKDAFIEDSTALGSNSALTGLALISAGAAFKLHDEAAVSTTGALVNDGNVLLDTNAGDGGSSLTLAGALTNSGDLTIGNATLSASDKMTAASLDNKGYIQLTGSGANQALLDVTGGAGFGTAGILSGNVVLAGDSVIEFASGETTSLAANAQLQLNGSDAFIEDSKALGSNSALTGLASIGAGATLDLENKAAVSTTGALVNDGNVNLDRFSGDGGSRLTVAGALTNNGSLRLDHVRGAGSAGGATLSIGGRLTNTHTLDIGGYGGHGLSAPDKVTAASLDNTGGIELSGSGANQALLDVTTGVAGFGTAGTLTGSVTLLADSAIEFPSGQIRTIAAGSLLTLVENDAVVEDSTALGSNSALTGLSNVSGNLSINQGASVSTTGSVTVANRGFVSLSGFGLNSTLSIAGGLTNSGKLEILAGDSVTAKSFVNGGTVQMGGGALAALNVSGAITNNGSILIASDTEELAGAVGGAGSFSLDSANLQFDSSVSAGQTIDALVTGHAGTLTLEQAQKFAGTISGFGTHDTIVAANFLLSGTTFNFVENSGGTGGTLALHDGSLTANILMTSHYSNSSFTLAPDSGTGTLVKFV
jgi:hypothetical protein